MRHVLLFLFLLNAFSVWVNCGTKQNVPLTDQAVKVDSIQIASIKDGAASIILKGNLPNPAYSLVRVDVAHNKDGSIVLTPWASYDSTRMVIQMLMPFEYECRIENLKQETEYTILINQNESIRQQLVVD